MKKQKIQDVITNVSIVVILSGLLGLATLISLLIWMGVITVWGGMFR